MLKELLIEALKEGYEKVYDEFGRRQIYLQFSAGCDSTALCWAMSALQDKCPFTCITYFYRQKKIYLNKMNAIRKMYNTPLRVVALTDEDLVSNFLELKVDGFKGEVLLDCLSGHLSIAKELKDSLVVNGSYADVLYGSYFFQFRPPLPQEKFNAIRNKLLNKHDQDGVHSLTQLLRRNNNILITPFKHPKVVEFFMNKSFEECGGTRKTLFKKEFASELKRMPYAINRQSQQIESGIRDFRRKKDKKPNKINVK
jgi:hypothetical protein